MLPGRLAAARNEFLVSGEPVAFSVRISSVGVVLSISNAGGMTTSWLPVAMGAEAPQIIMDPPARAQTVQALGR